MRIEVLIPYFRNPAWLEECLLSHRSREGRSAGITTSYTVLNQERLREEEAKSAIPQTVSAFVKTEEMHGVGGQTLPALLLKAMAFCFGRGIDIIVLADTDTLMLRDEWCVELVNLLFEEGYVAAGINPRSDSPHFANQVEWNWLAFRPSFWVEHLGTFDPAAWKVHDIGHLFTAAAENAKEKVYRWPMISRPYEGKAATICGTNTLEGPKPWVFHAFYSSRRIQDRIPESERSGILTPEQELEVWKAARR